MKRGGEEIYVGPLGHQSSQLISYFEVSFVALNLGDDGHRGMNNVFLTGYPWDQEDYRRAESCDLDAASHIKGRRTQVRNGFHPDLQEIRAIQVK